jgi:mono/diheme cytochrome c family protein
MSFRVLGFIGAGAIVGAMAVGSGATSEARQANPEAAKIANPVASTPESIAAGEAVYKRRCSGCHGLDAKGGPPKEEFLKPAPNLIDDKYDHGSSDGEMFYVIKNGVPPELVMDGWGGRISDTDIWNIVNYLRAQAKKSG